jgi:hypothetical protein
MNKIILIAIISAVFIGCSQTVLEAKKECKEIMKGEFSYSTYPGVFFGENYYFNCNIP